MVSYTPPLSVFFVWHPADANTVQPMVKHCSSMLQRDINKPFSRAMNLPIFYRTTAKKGVPSNINIESENSIIFIFLSKNIVGNGDWVEYIKKLPESDKIHIIPIALDNYAFNVGGRLQGKNFIRTYEYEELYTNYLIFISVAHEIYRLILNESFNIMRPGKYNALKIFLSHAKDGKQGIKLAKALKNFIDNSSMRNFFDATDIAPGYQFDNEIIDHIKESTIIAIHSDPYSSRYWCQREILCAKENHRPIVAVDCLEEFEDRRFPHAANIPGVHVNIGEYTEPGKKDLLRIVSVALLETIRFYYAKMLLTQYIKVNWIPNDAEILSRPPEATDIFKILINNYNSIHCLKKSVVYPEPPIYEEELAFFKNFGIEFFTPLLFNPINIHGKSIGISISDPSDEELIEIGHGSYHLIHLSQDLARHFLARGAKLVYGGDLRENGFTDFIFKEAAALQARLRTDNIHLKNYLAWPIFKGNTTAMTEWKAKYRHIAAMEEIEPPSDVFDLIPDKNSFLPPLNTQNSYVWSRCLTEMRNTMINDCEVRICAGGKHSGYKGKIPGVLEEIVIALEKKKPLYLLGGFGGVTASICKSIQTQVMNYELTEAWQIQNNAGYMDLLSFMDSRGERYKVDYKAIEDKLINAELNNGLSKDDNEKLFNTTFIDEAMHFIFKGLKVLYR
ncbi:MAG: TIR domain-containing protein [ANME-2 cluster archaeon]|nr:TIR domain-containing protein [ANME-2 cluster archaeon]MBC2699988.1 TIR domain-containing protein [ANME-2 cluster archaeon]MBC2709138.1 TIR domain-containing protein [ANME-2 cluster archaeon]MBC2746882.1 TIR domain-containing protein [ANME-2 cluster archaeon]